MTILATIILLGVLIFVHELGHFWAAKAVGVGVERFSIGLGPRLAGFRRGETEYVIAAIPLGGYVKMQGMEDEVMERLEGGSSDEQLPEQRPGDFDGKPIWARAFVISAGVIMNMLFAFGIYTFTAAYWGVEEAATTTTRVMAVQEGLLPAGAESLAEIVPGALITQVGSARPDSWSEIRQAFVEAGPGPLTVQTTDPSASFVVDIPEGETAGLRVVVALDGWIDPVIGQVSPGSAAEEGGLEEGDTLVSVAGITVASWTDMVRELGARPAESVELELRRDGANLVRVVELGEVTDPDTGERRGQLGVIPMTRGVRVSLGEAFSIGLDQTAYWTGLIVGFVRDLFTLNVSPRQVGSIGTIAQASGQAAADGMATFLRFMAFFSINLAVLNLLPIPILDGGHLVFLGIELIRGQALSIEQRVRWSQVGLVIVVGIMVWALGNDILRALGL